MLELRTFSRILLTMMVLLAFVPARASSFASGITYTGRIIKDDAGINSGTVRFYIWIRNQSGCDLYAEQRDIDMTDSDGTYSFEIGTGALASSFPHNGFGVKTLSDVFDNTKSTSDLDTSKTGCLTFTPTADEGRTMKVQFLPPGEAVAQALPDLSITAVPTARIAFSANQVNGYGTGDLLKVDSAVSKTTYANSALNQAQYDEFWKLILGTSTTYLKAIPTLGGDVSGTLPAVTVTKVQNVAVTAPTTGDVGKVLTYNGTGMVWQTAASGGITSINGLSGSTQSFAVGTAGTDVAISSSGSTHTINVPSASASNRGVLTSADWTAFNAKQSSSLASATVWVGNASGAAQARTITGDISIDNTGVATLAASLSGANKLPLAGGTMSGAINMGGNDIASAGNISMAANKYLGLSANSTDGTVAGQIWYDAGTIKYFDGSIVKSLGVAGAGITSLNGLSVGTQSFVTNTSGTDFAISSSGSAHTFSLPSASATNRGALTSADWTAFNAKQSNGLTSAFVWVGNSAGGAQARALSGDITVDNVGLVTLKNTGSVGTYYKVVTDAQGRVVSGSATLGATDMPSLNDGTIWIGNSGNTAVGYALSGDATMSNVGLLTLKNTGSVGTYSKVVTDAQGRVISGSALASADVTTALGYTPVNRAGDTMAGALNFGAYDVSNTGNIAMAANKYFGLSANGTNGTVAGQMWYDSGTIKYFDGTTVKSLGVAGAGITSLNGLSVGTQSFVVGSSGNSPAITSSGSAHTFDFPMASASGSVTAGLISNADYVNFNSKQSSSLAAGQVWVGNASGVAQAFSLSGDVASVSNSGSVVVNKSTTGQSNYIMALDGAGVANAYGFGIKGATSGTVTLQAAGVTANYSLKLPATTPVANQIMQSDASGNLSWVNSLSSSTAYINGGNTFAGNATIGLNDAYTLGFKTNNTTQMTIASNGNVGIGTTTPTTKLSVVDTTTDAAVAISRPAGSEGILAFATGTSPRWEMITTNAAESGSNAGSNFAISAYNDAGSQIRTDLYINRATGKIGIGMMGPTVSLDLSAKDDAIRLPQGTTALQPANATGLVRYNTTTNFVEFNNGSGWTSLAAAGAATLPSLASTQVWVGNASGGAEARALSGDVTISNVGLVTLKNTGTLGTYQKVVTDAQGRVASGSNLNNADVVAALGYDPVNRAGDNQTVLANGAIWVGNASGMADARIMSGDATISNVGLVTLKNTGTVGTYWKVVTDAQGRVSSGSALASGDVTAALGYTPGNSSTGYVNGGNTFAGNATIGLNDAYTLGFKTNNTTQMTLTSAGRLGIGTATPSGILDVQGGSAAANTAGANITLKAQNATGPAGVVGGSIVLTPGDGAGTWPGGSVVVATTDGQNGAITANNNTTSGYLTSSAAVSAPSYALRIANNYNFNSNTALVNSSVKNSSSIFQEGYMGFVSITGGANYSPDFILGMQTGATAYQERLRVVGATGNVGIGTANPSYSLDFNGKTDAIRLPAGTTAQQPANTAGLFRYNTTNSNVEFNNGSGWAALTSSSGASGAYINGGNTFAGNATIGLNDAYNLSFKTNNSTRMTITGAGNVGINNTNPTVALDVSANTDAVRLPLGTTAQQPTAATGLLRYNTTNNTVEYNNGTSWYTVASSTGATGAFINGGNTFGGNASIGLADNYDLSFKTNGTTRMTLSSTGKLGIGTTNPGSSLHVQNGQAAFEDNSNTVGGSNFSFWKNRNYGATQNLDELGYISFYGHDGSTTLRSALILAKGDGAPTSGSVPGQLGFYTTAAGSADSTERMRIVANGNVAIGAMTPTVSLDISSKTDAVRLPNGTTAQRPANAAGLLRYNTTIPALEYNTGSGWSTLSSITNGVVKDGNSFGAHMIIGTNDNYDFRFEANGSTAMTIEPSGEVGIGTTTPGYKLDIASTDGDVLRLNTYSATAAQGSSAMLYRARGTASSPTAVQANDTLGGVYSRGYGATGFGSASTAYIEMSAGQNFTDANHGTYMTFFTTDNNSATPAERMRIAQNGYVGVGTNNPSVPMEVSSSVTDINNANFQVTNTANLNTWQPVIGAMAPNATAGTHVQMVYGVNAQPGNRVEEAFVYAGNGSASNRYTLGLYGLDDQFTLNYAGKIGFFTASPAAKIQVGTEGAVSAPAQIFMGEMKTSGTARPQIIGNWNSTGNWGIGPSTSTSNDYRVKIGYVVDQEQDWSSAQKVTLDVDGPVVSAPGTVTGATVNLALSNTISVSAIGGSTITLQNMVHGGSYTLLVSDTTSRTYTFSGCNTSKFKPANTATVAGTSTMYNIITVYNGSTYDCWITWGSGYQ